VDGAGIVTSFEEKTRTEGGMLLNAGIYVFDARVRELVEAPETCSLERDVLPRIAQRGACRAFVTDAPVIDIGTPERYRAANKR
jgi:NDP-sugar pyrophosphorylase family protein